MEEKIDSNVSPQPITEVIPTAPRSPGNYFSFKALVIILGGAFLSGLVLSLATILAGKIYNVAQTTCNTGLALCFAGIMELTIIFLASWLGGLIFLSKLLKKLEVANWSSILALGTLSLVFLIPIPFYSINNDFSLLFNLFFFPLVFYPLIYGGHYLILTEYGTETVRGRLAKNKFFLWLFSLATVALLYFWFLNEVG